MNFKESFSYLKNKYEKKEKNQKENINYELLKKMINIYGYDCVCNEISFNGKISKGKKNNELTIFMDELKRNMPLDLLCSQIFYLDNSFSYSHDIIGNKDDTQNSISIKMNKNNCKIFKIQKKI